MDWSKRIVSNSFDVKQLTVNDIFYSYISDQFYVNRKYQRKLVWGEPEKSLLIDSMLNGIPIPAIFLVKCRTEGSSCVFWEIIDGMQRLEAIVSFILGRVGVNYEGKECYFDPESYMETFNLIQAKDSRLKRREHYLPKEVCAQFVHYQIPVIITEKDDVGVNLIFSRLNSTGRKISSHDLRQSSATGEFADLVRRIASNVRMDHTYDDHICLDDMAKISVGPKQQGYGVDVEQIFWRRHNLIEVQNLKESKDEEIIETLLAMTLLPEFKKSRERLDDLYTEGTELYKQIEAKVAECGKDNLERSFSNVFDVIDSIFNSVKSNFSSFLFTKKRVSNKDECFKLFFIAIYRLLEQGFVIVNYKTVVDAIRQTADTLQKITDAARVDYRRSDDNIEILYRILKPAFTRQLVSEPSMMQNEIDRRLSYSRIERQMTEFKVGISNFAAQSINKHVLRDIAKTLVAMANVTNAKEEGLVILGIADNKEAYNDWYAVYKEQGIIKNQHYVPGVSKEAQKLCKNTDEYFRKLRQLIAQEPISEKLKEYILETFEPVDYYGVELIVFKSKYVGEVSLYNGEKWIRHSNETLRVR